MKTRKNLVRVAILIVTVFLANIAFAQHPADRPGKGATLRAQVREMIGVTPQAGQKKEPGTRQEQYSQEELAQLRSALLDLANSIKDLAELAPGHFDIGKFDEATKQIADLSDAQLGRLRNGLNPAKMSEELATARASFAAYKLSLKLQGRIQIQAAGNTQVGAVEPNSPGFPVVSGVCTGSDGTGYGPNRIPVGVVLAADVVYFVAEGVRDAAHDGCNEVVVIAGEGGNTSAACIPVDVTYVLAHAVYAGIHFCEDQLTGNVIDANYARLFHIHGDLEASVANDNNNRTLIINNANTNTANIIANDNSNTTTILNNANANKNELRDLILRTQIEADLAEADSATPVAWYLTPTANGGHLDLVQSIVTDTLAKIKAAGGNIGNAQSFLDKANAAKAAGDFKGAYAWYKSAYKMAAK